MLIIGFFLLGCHHRTVGVIDIIDNGVCAVQIDEATTILVNGSKCKGLKEGDSLLMEMK
jgi:hypothetical protein